MEKMKKEFKPSNTTLSLDFFEDVNTWSYINDNKANLIEGVDYMIFNIKINIDSYCNVL